jgi:hypothetical protein
MSGAFFIAWSDKKSNSHQPAINQPSRSNHLTRIHQIMRIQGMLDGSHHTEGHFTTMAF